MRAAAEWAWRVVLLAGVALLVWQVLAALSLLVIAVFAAALLAALLQPAVGGLCRLRAPRPLSTLVVFLGGLGVLGLLVWFVVEQLVTNLPSLTGGVEAGVAQVRTWLVNGPLDLTARQVEQAVGQTTARLRGALTEDALATAVMVAEVLSGIALTLFLLYFFLYDGARVWAWVAHLFPRSVERDVQEAGQQAWDTLTGYIRGTVIVASIDGVLIGLALVVLGVPLAVPLGVLTFLGAFIPLAGATATGALAVLVALVSNGVTTALLVAAAVLAVQQIEGNLLAPLIVGAAVNLHPVAIVLLVTAGTLLAGVAGAVIAVPLAAVTNRVLTYFLGRDEQSPRPHRPDDPQRRRHLMNSSPDPMEPAPETPANPLANTPPVPGAELAYPIELYAPAPADAGPSEGTEPAGPHK